MFKKVLLGLAISLAFISVSNAGTVSGETITGTGCNSAGVCFINLSGGAFGPAACMSNQVTFDGTTSEGKSLYASALSAKVSNSEVRIGFDDVNCNGNRPLLVFVTIL